jgi:carbon-monoxide dehydrogenase iron sulfur subunit
MYKDENGIVRNIKEKCVGCQSCIMACPFGAIKMSVSGTVISKCDLCTKNGDEPACAKNCPNGALKFMDLEEDKKIR